MPQTLWGLHMAEIEQNLPIKENFIGIGWSEMGDLSSLPKEREAFKERLTEEYPDAKTGAIPVWAGVLYRFVHEMAVGDVVIYPGKIDRIVHLGIVKGDYEYHDSMGYPHMRKVKWIRHLPRANFSQAALYEIGSAITLFLVTTHADEFLAAMEGKETNALATDEASAEEVSSQVEETTDDFIIKRLKGKLTPYDFEKFIAHLLTCMGYHTRVTQQSGDGGIDVIAHRDELGFEPPIIKVQCKQTLEQIGRPKVQQLHGAIEQGEYGLFVTLGGYSPDARTYERSKSNLRLIDGTELAELIYAHYEAFDSRYKTLLPLKRSYLPGAPIGTAD